MEVEVYRILLVFVKARGFKHVDLDFSGRPTGLDREASVRRELSIIWSASKPGHKERFQPDRKAEKWYFEAWTEHKELLG
jgi:hypothetical protein